MGDGFIVAQSNHLDIYYYQDEPGKVPVTTSADTGLATNSTLFFCALFVEIVPPGKQINEHSLGKKILSGSFQ